MLRPNKQDKVGGIIVGDAGEAQARLEQAVSRLSGALERINDGIDRTPVPQTPEATSHQLNPEHEAELAALRDRVTALEGENKSLRDAGRLAAEGIGETIAALQAARS